MPITVPRPRLNWRERLYLPAIAAGLAITFKHFRNMLLGRTKVTMQYPEQKWDSHLPDHYRGAPTLVRDAGGRVRCVACQLCEFICPPRAIKIIPGEIPSSDRFAKVSDPYGHDWSLATHTEDVSPEEMGRRVQAWFAQMAAKA